MYRNHLRREKYEGDVRMKGERVRLHTDKESEFIHSKL